MTSHTPDPGLRAVADVAPCVLWAANADGAWLYVNPAWTRLTGQDADAALGVAWLDLVPEAQRQRVRRDYVNGILSAEPFEIRHDLNARDAGAPVSVLMRVHPEFRGDRQVVGFAGSCSLQQAVDHPFRTLVDHAPDIIARLDRGMRHLYVNHAIRDAFGIDPAAAVGKDAAQLGFPEDVACAFADVAQQVFDSGEQRGFDFTVSTMRGTRHFSSRVLPEFDGQGAVSSVLVITYDVTQRMLAQLERDALLIREQAARVQAEAAAQARDQFLSIVSHELRSPLNGIQSWTHVLENRVGGDSPPIARAIAGIKKGVQQQVRMIEDLIDATRVMTGKLRLVKQSFLLRPTIEAAIGNVARDAYERNIDIRTQFPDEDIRLVGSAERIEQIVWNLLTNAIKFSAPGAAVDVEVAVRDREICISVADSGKGIAPEFMPYLFDPFRQADASNTRRAEGLGLGLTLVQRLAELHGGRVTAYSEGENRGAVFTVYLPLAEEAPLARDEGVPRAVQADQGTAIPSLSGIRVLLIDDQREARDSLTELLQEAGAQVMPLESGMRALEYLSVIEKAGVPQVIVSDIAMPGQDGYVTLQQIRQMEKRDPGRFAAPIPAIALTAFGQREDRLKALASGFQVYLAKPANPSELVAIIDMLAKPSRTGAAQARH
ncbi:hypothetical protein GCM10023144_10670 [Pigmentiphaga soli]|uniref:histidine kinase n=1 Tax=Pigmentiphaga soli TaxID=1007095 RepID=A0ABP8GLZ2_9BURK